MLLTKSADLCVIVLLSKDIKVRVPLLVELLDVALAPYEALPGC
jgi:hypothetical protein